MIFSINLLWLSVLVYAEIEDDFLEGSFDPITSIDSFDTLGDGYGFGVCTLVSALRQGLVYCA